MFENFLKRKLQRKKEKNPHAVALGNIRGNPGKPHSTDQARKHARVLGRKGGRAGTGKVKARSSEQARRAAMVRWSKAKATH